MKSTLTKRDANGMCGQQSDGEGPDLPTNNLVRWRSGEVGDGMRWAVLFCMCVMVVARAQQLPKSQVFLQNAETDAVSFGLSCDDRQSWKPVTLKGHEGQRFECDLAAAKMWAHINTDLPGEAHQEAELPLQNGSRYELYFDQSQRKWSLRLMNPAAGAGLSAAAPASRCRAHSGTGWC